MDGLGRDKRIGRVRSGSTVSMGAPAGFGSGGDPQRETELSVAMENLTLEEIDGNVFRMSKDQVHGEAANVDIRCCCVVNVAFGVPVYMSTWYLL